MKRIFSYVPKKVLALALVAGTVLGITAITGAWSPERPTYTIENPADHVTFNSITNNPREGDERAFLGLKDAANTQSDGFAHKIDVKDGEEIVVRMYVHNNAATSLNGTNFDGVGVAKNTKVRVWLPSVSDNVMRTNAYISADNAAPKEVSDTADFYTSGGQKFTISYVPGSAFAYNNATGQAGMQLSDSIVTTGAPVGYTSANGVFPGCFQYATIVTMKVKVKMESANFTVQKQVSKDKTESNPSYSWQENIEANPGETVAYQLRFTNLSASQIDNVVLRDQLPKGFTIVPGSTMVKYGSDPTIKPAGSDAIVSNGGLMIGSYAANSGAVVLFKAVVPAASTLECGANVLTNIGEARVGSVATTDTANVTVNKDCPNPTPSYSCNALSVSVISTRKIRATTNYTALNGATLNNISYDFGDGSDKLVTNNTTVEHQYAADGTYTVRATPSFTVDGKVVTADSAACAKVITFKGGTPVEPPKSTPSTGPTATIGLFAGVSAIGAIGYRLWMIRRLGN